MKRLTIILLLAGAAVAVSLGFAGCELFTQTGTLSLSITDSPIDAANVSGVYITVNEIQYHRSDSDDWITMSGFSGPKKFNLLDLTGGKSELLGELKLYGGKYTQIRFILDAQEMPADGSTPQNPGCYITFNDGTLNAPLFAPSSGVSGYKATGAFEVPVNGTVEVTADFDVRKAVVETGDSRYILKPTIRLVVNNQAGKIAGEVTGGTDSLIVFAYEDGTWTSLEDHDPVESTDSRFPNAVASAKVESAGDGTLSYVLPFLAEGTYDLAVAQYDSSGVYQKTLGFVSNVSVESSEKTICQIDVGALDSTVQ